MATTFEQQFAVYEQSLAATHGKKAPGMVDQTKQLIFEWRGEGNLILTPLDGVCTKTSSKPEHWPITRGQVQHLHTKEEKRWQSAKEDKKRSLFSGSPAKNAEKHYQISNLFGQHLFLTTSDNIPDKQLACEPQQIMNLKAMTMTPDESLYDYVTRAETHYFQTMCTPYYRDEIHVQIFRDMVLAGLPAELYDTLANVAGLSVKSQSEWLAVVWHRYSHIKENNTQSESTAEMMLKIAQLQLLELVRQRKKEREEASDQAACEMLMVSAVISAPQHMGEGLVYPQSWFRGHTCREPGRRRKKSSYRGQFRKSMQYVKCWRCGKYGHVNRYCPHFLPFQNHKDNWTEFRGLRNPLQPRPNQSTAPQIFPTLAHGCCSHRVHNSATDFQSSQRYGTPIPSGPDIPPHSVPDHSLSCPQTVELSPCRT